MTEHDVSEAWRGGGRRVALLRTLGGSRLTRKPTTWFFLNVAPRIDRILLRASRGRLNTAFGMPVLLLLNRGAKSGQFRETPLGYFAGDQGAYVVIGSQGGMPQHPAWYFNLRAHPQAEIVVRGRRRSVLAREAEGTERELLWRNVLALAPNYGDYEVRAAPRRIPVMVLEPLS